MGSRVPNRPDWATKGYDAPSAMKEAAMSAPRGKRQLNADDLFMVVYMETPRVTAFGGLVELVRDMNTRPIIDLELHFRGMVRVWWDSTGSGDVVELHLFVTEALDMPASFKIAASVGDDRDEAGYATTPNLVQVWAPGDKDHSLYGVYYGERKSRR